MLTESDAIQGLFQAMYSGLTVGFIYSLVRYLFISVVERREN